LPRRDAGDLAGVLATKAAGDEAAVDALVKEEGVPNEVIGFHAQQAVEKRIKSVLAANDITFERTHNIAYLLGLLADHGVKPPAEGDDVATLTPWATEFRYEDRPVARSIASEHSRSSGQCGPGQRAHCEPENEPAARLDSAARSELGMPRSQHRVPKYVPNSAFLRPPNATQRN
jgi:HEPN domain-containing protein